METCSQCGIPIEKDAVFCFSCGADVREEVSGFGLQPPAPEASTGLEEDDLDTDVEIPSVRTLSRPEAARAAVESMPGPLSECDDLELHYDAARIFMEGMTLPFAFRLVPQCSGISDLSLEIHTQHGLNARKRLLRVLRSGVERAVAVDVPIKKGCIGIMTFDFILRYRAEGISRMFMVSRTHEVHPERNARKVFENFRIEINQGHAGDINQNFQGLENLLRNEDWGKVFSQLQIEPRWEKLALEECEDCGGDCTDHLPPPPDSARVDRLTLTLCGWKIHLLSGDRLQLGRSRECDLVTRVFDASGTMPREDNLRISKRHCGLVARDGAILVVNGDLNANPGGKAVYLNGRPVEEQEPLTDEFLLTFANPEPTQGVFGFKGRKINLPDSTAGVALMRTDSVKEIFVVVYERVRLGLADPRWGDLCVCRKDGAFGIRDGDGGCRWLTLGSREFADSKLIEIKPFGQWGLE